MTLPVLAYLAGLLTVASPCILPILPIILARGNAPMLLGLAAGFAALGGLAGLGAYAAAASDAARSSALAVMALSGLALLVPTVADRLLAPVADLGARLSASAARHGTLAWSLLLGLATGLAWAPCAGPVLAAILSAAALQEPGSGTLLPLFAYALGAATALGAALLAGRRLLRHRLAAGWTEGLRRVAGAAAVVAAAAMAFGLDARLLAAVPATSAGRLEQRLAAALPTAQAAPVSGPLAAALAAAPWVNGAPLRAEDLRGKPVLVSFWTYSCVNCLRALPHIAAWAERYRDQGLVVLGVHAPEFAFERDPDNVGKSAATLGIRYPVVLDNDFRVWRAFGNQAWPALYLIDREGTLRRRQLGEGNYDRLEGLIRDVLAEGGTEDARPAPTAAPTAAGAQAPADLANLASPETYLGYGRATDFASPDPLVEELPRRYRPAARLPPNHWTLQGLWAAGREFVTLDQAPGALSHRFHARDLHLVLAPAVAGRPVRFRVTLDGAAPGASHGADVDAGGWGTLREPRLYQLIRQPGPVTDRTFRIEFLEEGARAYAFTFG